MYWPVWRDREWNGYHWWGFGPHNRPWHHMGGLSVVVTVGRWALELDFDLRTWTGIQGYVSIYREFDRRAIGWIDTGRIAMWIEILRDRAYRGRGWLHWRLVSV